MELSSSNIKKIPCILSQKKTFLRFGQKKSFPIFPKTEPYLFQPKPKKTKKTYRKRIFLAQIFS